MTRAKFFGRKNKFFKYYETTVFSLNKYEDEVAKIPMHSELCMRWPRKLSKEARFAVGKKFCGENSDYSLNETSN